MVHCLPEEQRVKYLKRKLQNIQSQQSTEATKNSSAGKTVLASEPSNFRNLNADVKVPATSSHNIDNMVGATSSQQPHTLYHTNSHCSDKADSGATRSIDGLFSGMQINDLLFIEIFAGSGKLTKAARVWQFETMAIDKTVKRSTGTRISVLDLSEPDEAEALKQLIKQEHKRIVAIHLAPACGTASKAREKELKSFSAMGIAVPVPLRSQEQPLGKDGLGGLDKLRTELVNQVYSFTAEILELCISLDILGSVENPKNSLFWEYPEIKRLLEKGWMTVFDSCMHGGRRKKGTSWWATKATYTDLQATCDGSHQHSSSTVSSKGLNFPTAEEAAYPDLLCKRVSAIIHAYASQEGAVEPQDLVQQLAIRHHTSHRWILDMLPRGKKYKPLVSEFAKYVTFAVATSLEPEQSWFFKEQPKGTRVTSRHLQWGCLRVDEDKCLEWKEDKTG